MTEDILSYLIDQLNVVIFDIGLIFESILNLPRSIHDMCYF